MTAKRKSKSPKAPKKQVAPPPPATHSYYTSLRIALDGDRRIGDGMTWNEIFKVAALSGCDPRTVRRYWACQMVNRGVAIRLDAAMVGEKLLKPPKQPILTAEQVMASVSRSV